MNDVEEATKTRAGAGYHRIKLETNVSGICSLSWFYICNDSYFKSIVSSKNNLNTMQKKKKPVNFETCPNATLS